MRSSAKSSVSRAMLRLNSTIVGKSSESAGRTTTGCDDESLIGLLEQWITVICFRGVPLQPQMLIGRARRAAALPRARQQRRLKQERLDHIDERIDFLAHRRGDRFDAYPAAFVRLNHRTKE